jgi:hypothetical protein
MLGYIQAVGSIIRRVGIVIGRIKEVSIVEVSNGRSVGYLNVSKPIILRLGRGCNITLEILAT